MILALAEACYQLDLIRLPTLPETPFIGLSARICRCYDKALGLADWNNLNLHRPYVEMTKSDLVSLGEELNAPLHLTWSCYTGGEIHCGNVVPVLNKKKPLLSPIFPTQPNMKNN